MMPYEVRRRQGLPAALLVLLAVLAVMLAAAAAFQWNTLAGVEQALARSQSELAAVRAEFQAVSGNLSGTRDDLEKSRVELSVAQASLAQREQALAAARRDLAQAKIDLTAARTSLAGVQGELGDARASLETAGESLASLQTKADSLQAEYDRLTSGYGYVYNDPTYEEMKAFLAADATSDNKYDIRNYNCQNYSRDVIASAAGQKIRAGYVAIDYNEAQGHAIVAFDTTDRGVVYIEPQTDEEVLLETGKRYHESVIPRPGYYYPRPDFDDTVARFLVIW